jgi:hypothetical protein
MPRAKSTGNPTAADKRALIEQIEQTFASVLYPGDNRICIGVTDEDRRLLGTEQAEIEAAFKGLHWREVPLEVLNCHQSALSFFSPEAFRFYLPAFMLASLGVPRWPSDLLPAGVGIKNAVIWSLDPPKEMSWKPRSDPTVAWFLERMSGFNPEQKAAIRTFLSFAGSRDAKVALARYWEPRKDGAVGSKHASAPLLRRRVGCGRRASARRGSRKLGAHSHGRSPRLPKGRCSPMSAATFEGIVEHGQIRPKGDVQLSNGAKVYVLAPEMSGRPVARVVTPRPAHPEQAGVFKQAVSEEANYAGVSRHLAFGKYAGGRDSTLEEFKDAEWRGEAEFDDLYGG